MKKFKFYLLFILGGLFVGCSGDDDGYNQSPSGPEPTGNMKTYVLDPLAIPSISGVATFIELNDNSVTIELELQNTPSGGIHPAHIHFNSAVETGGIAVSLNPVDGSTGESITNISTLDDGSPISFDQLLNFNGYINVHLSAQELSTIVAQADIGQNELTGETKTYNLEEADVPGISGIAEFAERKNGTSLLTITLDGTPSGGNHPAHIHENDAATSGPIIVGLNPVNGDTGISKTQISELVGGGSLSFSDILTLDAYINVHLSQADLTTIVAVGNIGTNEGAPPAGDAINFDVTNSGASAYIFNGNGFSNASNPDLTLQRGQTYTFTVNAPGHPFYINSSQGTGNSNAFNNGVTNNGAVNGIVTFTVPDEAPSTLFYNCEFHGSMTGVITITD